MHTHSSAQERRSNGAASFHHRAVERNKENRYDDDDDDDDDDEEHKQQESKDGSDKADDHVANVRERRFRDFASVEYNGEIYMVIFISSSSPSGLWNDFRRRWISLNRLSLSSQDVSVTRFPLSTTVFVSPLSSSGSSAADGCEGQCYSLQHTAETPRIETILSKSGRRR